MDLQKGIIILPIATEMLSLLVQTDGMHFGHELNSDMKPPSWIYIYLFLMTLFHKRDDFDFN